MDSWFGHPSFLSSLEGSISMMPALVLHVCLGGIDDNGPQNGDSVSAVSQTKDWVQVAVSDGEFRWLPKRLLKPVGEIQEVALDDRPGMPLVREEWITRDGAFQDVECVSVEHGHEILQDGVAIWDVPGWVQHSLSSSFLISSEN